jgi:RNA recognition motif. (a.k.a. RRM, RBD, or RNP domain)
MELVGKYGEIREVQVLRDRIVGHKGCAFIRFGSITEADAAIRDLNGYTLNGSQIPITMSWATREDERLGLRGVQNPRKVIIGSLPQTATENDIKKMLEPLCTLESVQLQTPSIEECTVQVHLLEDAITIKKEVNGKLFMGLGSPLIVYHSEGNRQQQIPVELAAPGKQQNSKVRSSNGHL